MTPVEQHDQEAFYQSVHGVLAAAMLAENQIYEPKPGHDYFAALADKAKTYLKHYESHNKTFEYENLLRVYTHRLYVCGSCSSPVVQFLSMPTSKQYRGWCSHCLLWVKPLLGPVKLKDCLNHKVIISVTVEQARRKLKYLATLKEEFDTKLPPRVHKEPTRASIYEAIVADWEEVQKNG